MKKIVVNCLRKNTKNLRPGESKFVNLDFCVNEIDVDEMKDAIIRNLQIFNVPFMKISILNASIYAEPTPRENIRKKICSIT